ncbi:hypothetical protein JTE90_004539 [Oedothorax gibbosus]|uniref:Secreted protein n=1 Tax=Oedothorax gibbosus TaxID=931172 RepID=A0AAV6VF35_9ARAC|nr:hypothetical protein JTE90_004539 [Oedothorax gibbosus]
MVAGLLRRLNCLGVTGSGGTSSCLDSKREQREEQIGSRFPVWDVLPVGERRRDNFRWWVPTGKCGSRSCLPARSSNQVEPARCEPVLPPSPLLPESPLR